MELQNVGKELNTQDKYRAIRQNPISDNISKALLDTKEKDEYGNARVSYVGTTPFELVIEGFETLKDIVNNNSFESGRLPQSSAKLLDCLLIKMTETGFNLPNCELSLKEYAQMVGKKDIKELRTAINIALLILKRVIIRTVYNRKYAMNTTIFDSVAFKNGKIYVVFSVDFLTPFVTQRHFLPMPLELLKTNARHQPHLYLLQKKIISHKRINLGRPNENIMTVKELYDYCTTLPSYSIVLSSNGGIDQRIIQPFEDALSGVSYIDWEYVDYPEEGFRHFDDWYNARIKLEWKEDFIGRDTIIKGKQKQNRRIEKAKVKALTEVEKSKKKN